MPRKKTTVVTFTGTAKSFIGVTFKKLLSRDLVTVGPNSPWWESMQDQPGTKAMKMSYAGAIVRLQPPSDATDAHVEKVVAVLKSAGAERVTVMPRPRAKIVKERRPHEAVALAARKVVEALVEESQFAEKRELSDLAEKTMAEVGL